jgi:glycosyltransferase involved in cell wall biosynthesis
VNERNGILVEAGNEKALEEAMKKMILYRDQYDSQQISRDASALYAYETVARKILDVYDKVLEKK